MKAQDIGILIVSGLAVLVSLHGQAMFGLRKHWVEVIDTSLYANGAYATPGEVVPRPIASDVDGDGMTDLIVVTREPKIKILDTDSAVAYYDGDDEIDVFPVKSEASLLASVLVNTGRQAVAVETGYLGGFDTAPAKQVIVVVLQEWTVLCFDHNLKLLWETQLQDEVNQVTHNKIWREVSIVITDQPIHKLDKGAVIVGGRLVASPELVQEMGMHEEYETHFDYIALDGAKGHIRWKHASQDFTYAHDEDADHKLATPQIQYKLSVEQTKHQQKQTKEADWRTFRQAMMSSLPHRWQSRDQTHMFPAHILPDAVLDQRNSTPTKSGHGGEARGDPRKARMRALTFPTHHMTKIIKDLGVAVRRNKAGSEEDDHANTIVAHIKGGIEVIHFFTGMSVCQMPMDTGSTHVDINEDGNIDHISGQYHHADVDAMQMPTEPGVKGDILRAAFKMSDSDHLVVKASTGMPAHSDLFQVPLLMFHSRRRSLYTKVFARMGLGPSISSPSRDFSGQGATPDSEVFELAPLPAVLRQYDPKTGREDATVVYLESTGVMYCVGPRHIRDSRSTYRVKWSAQTMCGWDPSDDEEQVVPPHPSLEVARLDSGSDEPYIICTGAKAVSVVSQHGVIITETELEGTPVSAPQVMDVTDDGLLDLVVETSAGYYGYELTLSGKGVVAKLTTGLIMVVASAAVAAMVAQQQGPAGVDVGKQRRAARLERSRYRDD